MTGSDPPARGAPPGGPAGRRVLGRDPFAELAEPEPWAEKLDEFGAGWVRRTTEPRTRPARDTAQDAPERSETPVARPQELPREPRRRWTTTPPLSEIEPTQPRHLLDRLMGEEERRRLASLAHLVEGEASYDRFGFSPETVRKAFPFFHALYRLYFRVQSEGHAHLPAEGPAVLAGNHGGLLPFDAAMAVMDVALRTDPPRLARAIVDRWAGALPWINVFFARVGQVVGTRENFADLLDDGQLVLVFPEGIEGIRKTVTQRYRLQHFRVGFVEQALRAKAPILYDVKPLARRLGLPVAPITPTFPWLGPLGLLPYPVRYRIVYGEPLHYHERFGPEGAEDARLVRYLANQVRRAVQLLVDRSR